MIVLGKSKEEKAIVTCPICNTIPKMKYQKKSKNIPIDIKCLCSEETYVITNEELESFVNPVNKKPCQNHHSIMSEKYCLECRQWLCKECLINHNSNDIFKNHKFFDKEVITDLSCQSSNCNNDHYNFYCFQCKIYLCKSCKKNHKNHKIIQYYANKVYEKAKKKYEKSLEYDYKFLSFKNNLIEYINKIFYDYMDIKKQYNNFYYSLLQTYYKIGRIYPDSKIIDNLRKNEPRNKNLEQIIKRNSMDLHNIKAFINFCLSYSNKSDIKKFNNKFNKLKCIQEIKTNNQNVNFLLSMNERIIASTGDSLQIYNKIEDKFIFEKRLNEKDNKKFKYLYQLQDGKIAICFENEKYYKILNLNSLQFSKPLIFHNDEVNKVIQLKNGNMVSCGNDGKINVINSETYEIIQSHTENFLISNVLEIFQNGFVSINNNINNIKSSFISIWQLQEDKENKENQLK